MADDKTTTTYWNCCDELDEYLQKTFPDLVKEHTLHIEHSGGFYFHYCLLK